MQETPVDVRKADQVLAQAPLVLGHEPHARHQFFADVFGDGSLLDFGGEVEAALGRVLMEGTLEEEVQALGDEPLELCAAEPEGIGSFTHMYAYTYAHYKAREAACQEGKVKKLAKNRGQTQKTR